LDVLAETREVLVLRVHGSRPASETRGCIIYVPAPAEPVVVARQLRDVAAMLEKPSRGAATAPLRT
jgi:predicted transcriptional regulator